LVRCTIKIIRFEERIIVGYNKFCTGESKIQRKISSSNCRGFYKLAKETATLTATVKTNYVMRFVIPVVFYEVTNVECVYRSNTTIFIGRIQSNSHRPTFPTHTRSRAYFTPFLPHPYKQPMYVLYNCLYVQPEDGHYQAPKHVVVP